MELLAGCMWRWCLWPSSAGWSCWTIGGTARRPSRTAGSPHWTQSAGTLQTRKHRLKQERVTSALQAWSHALHVHYLTSARTEYKLLCNTSEHRAPVLTGANCSTRQLQSSNELLMTEHVIDLQQVDQTLPVTRCSDKEMFVLGKITRQLHKKKNQEK